MTCRLYFVLTLAAAALVCAQADWRKEYIKDVFSGEEAIQQACFVHQALWDAVYRFRGEAVVQRLDGVLAEVGDYLKRNAKSARSNPCNKFRRCELASKFKTDRELTGQRFADAQCFRWSKFERLCELIEDKKSLNKQMVAIEDWVCQVSYDHRMEMIKQLDDRCKEPVRGKAQKEADKDLKEIVSYTKEDLEKARRALNEELAAEKALKDPYDAQVAQEAAQEVKDRVAKHFADYQSCWAAIELEEAQKKAEEAAKEAEAAKKRGLFGKILHCVASSCIWSPADD